MMVSLKLHMPEVVLLKNETNILVLYQGENINGKKDNLNTIGFSKSDFNLSMLESNTTTYKKIQENSLRDLFTCYENLIINNKNNNKKFTLVENCSLSNLHNVLGEMYKRIIVPFYIPVIILISILIILPTKESINYFKFKIFTFSSGIFIIIFSETTIRFIEGSMLSNIKIFMVPILLILFLYITIFYKFKTNYKNI